MTNDRRWFSNDLHTELKDQDLNAILGQIRYVIDFFGITDVEGDDSLLQKAISVGASSLTGNIALLQGLPGDVDRVPYWTAPSSMSTFTATSYSRSLLAKSSLLQWQEALGFNASL